MKAKIALVTIWTDHMEKMKTFYHEALGFEIANDLGNYVEFKNEGVRFAICTREVMYPYTDAYRQKTSGQNFELAFPCESIEALESTYQELINRGAKEVQPPQNMPWHQRTALFEDPDGNIHEIFTELED